MTDVGNRPPFPVTFLERSCDVSVRSDLRIGCSLSPQVTRDPRIGPLEEDPVELFGLESGGLVHTGGLALPKSFEEE